MRAGILLRNEWLKARRRTAFWVAALTFGGIATLIYGTMFFEGTHGKPPALVLPAGWGVVLGGPGILAAYVGAIVVILLVSGEFTWRTARQNVIDGLSKEEFFAAKLLLVPGTALFYLGALVAVGGGFALAATIRAGAPGGPLVRPADVALLGGALVGLLGWVSLGFCLAMTIRAPGAAIGSFFLYVLVEQILGQLVGALGATGAAVARFVPGAVFSSLWNAARYGAAPLPPGQALDVATRWLVGAGVAWSALLVAGAYALYQRRDL